MNISNLAHIMLTEYQKCQVFDKYDFLLRVKGLLFILTSKRIVITHVSMVTLWAWHSSVPVFVLLSARNQNEFIRKSSIVDQFSETSGVWWKGSRVDCGPLTKDTVLIASQCLSNVARQLTNNPAVSDKTISVGFRAHGGSSLHCQPMVLRIRKSGWWTTQNVYTILCSWCVEDANLWIKTYDQQVLLLFF